MCKLSDCQLHEYSFIVNFFYFGITNDWIELYSTYFALKIITSTWQRRGLNWEPISWCSPALPSEQSNLGCLHFSQSWSWSFSISVCRCLSVCLSVSYVFFLIECQSFHTSVSVLIWLFIRLSVCFCCLCVSIYLYLWRLGLLFSQIYYSSKIWLFLNVQITQNIYVNQFDLICTHIPMYVTEVFFTKQ